MDDGTAAEQEDIEEPMNVRQGSWGQAIVAALVVAIITVAVNKTTDHHDETATATSIATLTERVSTLTEQVRRLNEQPYARREDFNAVSNRLDGLERRVDSWEQRASRAGR